MYYNGGCVTGKKFITACDDVKHRGKLTWDEKKIAPPSKLSGNETLMTIMPKIRMKIKD